MKTLEVAEGTLARNGGCRLCEGCVVLARGDLVSLGKWVRG